MLKNVMDEVCFERHWSTCTLLRNEEGHFVKNDELPLDGIVAIGGSPRGRSTTCHRYTDNLVFLDSNPDVEKYYSIVPNYHLAVRQVLQSFWKHGYERIAYLGSVYTSGPRKSSPWTPAFTIIKTLCGNGGCFAEELVLDCEMNSASSYALMHQYLGEGKPLPGAIFAASDVVAPGLLRALREFGFQVPRDVGIITFTTPAFPSGPAALGFGGGVFAGKRRLGGHQPGAALAEKDPPQTDHHFLPAGRTGQRAGPVRQFYHKEKTQKRAFLLRFLHKYAGSF